MHLPDKTFVDFATKVLSFGIVLTGVVSLLLKKSIFAISRFKKNLELWKTQENWAGRYLSSRAGESSRPNRVSGKEKGAVSPRPFMLRLFFPSANA
jgi:hypothetical protein